MAWTTPRTWSVNEVLTAAEHEHLHQRRPVVDGDLSPARPGHGRLVLAQLVRRLALTRRGIDLHERGDGLYVDRVLHGTQRRFYLLGADGTFASNATGARAIMLSSGADGTARCTPRTSRRRSRSPSRRR